MSLNDAKTREDLPDLHLKCRSPINKCGSAALHLGQEGQADLDAVEVTVAEPQGVESVFPGSMQHVHQYAI